MVAIGEAGRCERYARRAPARPSRAGRPGAGRRRASPADPGRRRCRCRPASAGPGLPLLDVERDRQRRPGVVEHPAQHRLVVVVEPAENGDHQATVRGLGEPPDVVLDVRGGLHDGEGLEQRAGVELGLAEVPDRAGVLAGGGDQPDGEAALAQVAPRPTPRPTRRPPGTTRCPGRGARGCGCRGRPWPATARAAPRGAPSARRRGRSCASGRGAGRRRGGTRARSRPRRGRRRTSAGRLSPEPVQAPPSGIEGSAHGARRHGQRDRGAEGAAELDHPERVAHPHAHRADLEAPAHVGADLVGHVAAPAVADPLEHEARAGRRARRGPGPRAAAGRSASGPRWSAPAARAPAGRRRPAAG